MIVADGDEGVPVIGAGVEFFIAGKEGDAAAFEEHGRSATDLLVFQDIVAKAGGFGEGAFENLFHDQVGLLLDDLVGADGEVSGGQVGDGDNGDDGGVRGELG